MSEKVIESDTESKPVPGLDYETPATRQAIRRERFGTRDQRILVIIALVEVQASLWITATKADVEGAPVVAVLSAAIWFTSVVLIVRHFVRGHHADALVPSDQSWSWKAAAVLAVLVLLFSVQYDSCPHAKYIRVGPFFWTFGTACGSPRDFKSVLWHLLSR